MNSNGFIKTTVFKFCLAVTHSLQYFYTASTGIERFPRFVAVGVVDGEQIDYYDSVSEKNVLKQTWMEGVRDESSITDIRRGTQQTFQGNIGIAMERFNQTTGKIFSPNGDLFTHFFIYIFFKHVTLYFDLITVHSQNLIIF